MIKGDRAPSSDSNSVNTPASFSVVNFELTNLSIPVLITNTITQDAMFCVAMYAAVPLYIGSFGIQQYQDHRYLCSVLSFLCSVNQKLIQQPVGKWLKTQNLQAEFVSCEDSNAFHEEAAKDPGYLTLYKVYTNYKLHKDVQVPYIILKVLLATVGRDVVPTVGWSSAYYGILDLRDYSCQRSYNYFSGAFVIRKNIILELMRISKSKESLLVATVKHVLKLFEYFETPHVPLLERYILPQTKEFFSQFAIAFERTALERMKLFLSSKPPSERPFLTYLYSESDCEPLNRRYLNASVILAEHLDMFYTLKYKSQSKAAFERYMESLMLNRTK